MLKATHYDGVVTCCGLVASAELTTSIFPFILRGVHLAGIDSVQAPLAVRQDVWQQLAMAWKPANLDALVQEVRLPDVPAQLDALLHGQAKGRYVVIHT
jgi:NADPH:quinone reductase-like Zn-dependent oxidoreductase